MARSKTIYSGKSKSHKVRGKRYNPNVSRYKLFICHILSKLSVNKEVTYKKNRNVDSQNKSREMYLVYQRMLKRNIMLIK